MAINKRPKIIIVFTIGIVAVIIALIFYFINEMYQGKKNTGIKRYAVEYSKSQQLKYDINCHSLKTDLSTLLNVSIATVINRRQPGQNWESFVSTELKDQIDSYGNYLFICRQIYVAGDEGKLNGFEDLKYIPKIDSDYAVVGILTKYGGSNVNCNSDCLDNQFSQLKEKYQKILSEINQQ